MKKTIILALLSCGALSASGAVIETLSGDLSDYTSTVILDANGGSQNTASWSLTGDSLALTTSTYDGIQQYAMIYDGFSLSVGDEVKLALTHTGASQDIGLYVGGTAPTFNVRQDYVAVYARGNGELYSRGFDGTGELGLSAAGIVTYDSLFIARTGSNTYELGYYDGATRTVIVTRTPTTANDGEYVGIYADVRAVGTLGSLTVVPEPSIALLGGLGLLGLARRRR
ncbi:hypothetical protein HNR46_001939 [Haloferula luteola]|uniref:Ice-binding protein C-terminal domain-containing protein n=1 Tax=Haloferula luteola TaxID=595692 RepID=A0A840VCS3_9BACT|nr:PEP-CTERM sorting domain-containing protein [Haloferula luteola]MBB5351700.1 hypothetical protein [Haloferula luteola]